MAARRVFVSYSRQDKAAVEWLAQQLRRLGQEVWLDQQLAGGAPWWQTILEQIKNCDCFVFAESKSAIESAACLKEVGYAHKLGKPILPVLVGTRVPSQLLPPYLAETQRVEAGTTDAVYSIASALLALPPSPPLPEPLPEPPSVPVSYMTELSEKVAAASLDLMEQRNLFAELKDQLSKQGHEDAATELLRRFRGRSDVYASVAAEIDAALSKPRKTPGWPRSGEKPFHEIKPPPSEPRSTENGGRRKRRRLLPLLVALVGLALVLLVVTYCFGEDAVCTHAEAVIALVGSLLFSIGTAWYRWRRGHQ